MKNKKQILILAMLIYLFGGCSQNRPLLYDNELYMKVTVAVHEFWHELNLCPCDKVEEKEKGRKSDP